MAAWPDRSRQPWPLPRPRSREFPSHTWPSSVGHLGVWRCPVTTLPSYWSELAPTGWRDEGAPLMTAKKVSDAEIAEIPYTAFASKKGQAITARLIVRRVRDLNHKAGQGQGELFPVWRYHPVFTDSPSSVQAEEQHRDHAVVEQVFADQTSLDDSGVGRVWLLIVLVPGFGCGVWLLLACSQASRPDAAGRRRLQARRDVLLSCRMGWFLLVSWVLAGRSGAASRSGMPPSMASSG